MEKSRNRPISQGMIPVVRNMDTDALVGMWQELMDLAYFLAGKGNQPITDKRIYQIVSQSLGI